MSQTLIIGAGPAGLGAAHTLDLAGKDFEVIESTGVAGGLARTDVIDGFSFDRSGHFLHMRSEKFRKVVEASGIALERVERKSAVVINTQLVPYPLQYNLWAFNEADRLAILRETKSPTDLTSVEISLGDALESAWGPTLVNRFFRPYNEKLFSTQLENVPADCLGRFIPSIDRKLLERGCTEPVDGIGYNSEFLYPASGRIGELFEAISLPFLDRISFGEIVYSIDTKTRRLLTNRRQVKFDQLISTLPLPTLLRACGLNLPVGLPLRSIDVWNIRVAFRGRMLRNEHWIYVPDPALDFYRIGFPANVNPLTCPTGTASLSIECSLPSGIARHKSVTDIAAQALRYVQDLGIIECEAYLFEDDVVLSPAYVLDRSPGRAAFDAVFSQLSINGIHTAGRYGRWDYLSMEDAFIDGIRSVRNNILGEKIG